MTKKTVTLSFRALLDFYERVMPVLSEWLAKPVWSAHEAAALCSGYVPVHGNNAGGDEPRQPTVPLDSEHIVPARPDLFQGYLFDMRNMVPKPPRDVMQSIALTPPTRMGSIFATHKVPLNRHTLVHYQWACILSNAVGLPVPALVPFGLLEAFAERRNLLRAAKPVVHQEGGQDIAAGDDAEHRSAKLQRESVDDSEGHDLFVGDGQMAIARGSGRRYERPQLHPRNRGFYTTGEVSALTELAPETLTRYARSGTPVAGFTPFKPEKRRAWHWRDAEQQRAVTAP